MSNPKSVMLDYELFVDLYIYACRHSEPNELQFKRLCAGVKKKLEAMTRHDMYSLYKSGANEHIRGKARRDYLNAIGLLDTFQWPTEQDVNVTHKEIDIR